MNTKTTRGFHQSHNLTASTAFKGRTKRDETGIDTTDFIEKEHNGQALYFHWDKLIEGRILKEPYRPPTPLENWDMFLRSSSQTSLQGTKASVFRNWDRIGAKTPPLPKHVKELTSKSKIEAFENWDRIADTKDIDNVDIALSNWNNLVTEQNPYEKYYNKRPPSGVKMLFEKKSEYDAKVLTLKVKNSKGERHDVQLKLSSPDKSILSAHIADNNDGTFTIFCCPRTDNDFNMFVSLYGTQFKHEIKVLNFYGSFAGLRKKEMELACRTVSLLRWHLTPGLLKRKGGKIVPTKPR